MSNLGNKKTLSQNLQRLMNLHKIDRNKLCADLGFKYSTVSEWLSANKYPRIDKIELMANYFNVQKSDLIEEHSNPQPNATILDTKIRMIPLYESVSAGFGVCAQDTVIDYIPLPIDSDFEAAETICIKVSGDSMYPKIEDGDIIVVRKQESIDSGRVGVFLINEEDAVVKKVKYEEGEDWLILISFNPEYQPRRFEGADVQRVQVLGLVKQVIKEI